MYESSSLSQIFTTDPYLRCGFSNSEELEVYQCSDCLTVYDDSLGDKGSDIEVDTLFKNLPLDYQCDVCGGSKENLKPIKLQY